MRDKALVALLVLAAAACSSAPTDRPANGGSGANPDAIGIAIPNEGATPEQGEALVALERDTHRSWTALLSAETKTAAHLASERIGAPILRPGRTVEEATVEFLGKYKPLFRMRDPRVELAKKRETKDELGMTHARFQQVTRGVPVVGAEVTAHYDAEGRLTSVDASYVPDIDIDVSPRIDVKTGLDRAKREALAAAPDITERDLEPAEGRLVVVARSGAPPRLAYEYEVRAIAGAHPAIWITTIDAVTGAIVGRYDNLQTIEATAPGALGTMHKFHVSSANGGFVMIDMTRGVQIRTFTAQNQQVTPGAAVTSTSLTEWDRVQAGAGAAVDAHAHAAIVFDYYKAKHQRNGVDGNGGAMVSTAHFGTSFDNAFWDGRGMTYGDGGQIFRPLSAGLDVVAHEFTHGIIQRTSNLRYENQSGALNEAVADIFGCFIEHAAKPDPVRNWQMGEGVAKGLPNGLMRDAKNPALGRQPAHMTQYRNTQQDNGGVHINSGIINQAAWLMTEGGTNPVSKVEVKFGIGWDKSEKLWYRANAQYFQETTTFGQAAQGVLEAAKDIGLTPNEINIVDCAFKAVGIAQGTCATIVDPRPPPAQPTTDPPGTGDADSKAETTGSEGDTGSRDSAEVEHDEEATSSGNRRRPRGPNMYASESGCSAGARGGADPGAFAALAGAMVGLAIARRKTDKGRARKRRA